MNKLILIIFTSLLFISCSKNDNNLKDNLNGNFFVSVLGVEEMEEIEFNPDLLAGNKIDYVKGEILTELDDSAPLITADGLDILQFLPNEHKKGIMKKKMSKVASTPLTSAFKYKVLLYKKISTNNYSYIGEIDGVSGSLSSANLEIEKDADYKWCAYSLNSASTLPSINTSTNVLDVEHIRNKDLLYSSGEFRATTGDNSIRILFKHHASKLTVKIDSRGMFGPFVKLDAILFSNNTRLKSASLNVLTGNYQNEVNFQPITVNHADWTSELNNHVKTYSVYCNYVAETHTTHNLSYTLKGGLEIQTDYGNNRVFPENIIVPEKTLSVIPTNSIITFKKGLHSIVRLNLIESGIEMNSSPILLMARGNLYYDPTDPIGNNYKLRHQPDHYYTTGISDEVELWNYLIDLPFHSSYQVPPISTSTDPCRKLYPNGLWLTPVNTSLYSYSLLSEDFNRIWDDAKKIVKYERNTNLKTSSSNTLNAYGYDLNTLFVTLQGIRDASGNLSEYQSAGIFRSSSANPVDVTFSNTLGALPHRAEIRSPSVSQPTVVRTAYGPANNHRLGYSIRCIRVSIQD